MGFPRIHLVYINPFSEFLAYTLTHVLSDEARPDLITHTPVLRRRVAVSRTVQKVSQIVGHYNRMRARVEPQVLFGG